MGPATVGRHSWDTGRARGSDLSLAEAAKTRRFARSLPSLPLPMAIQATLMHQLWLSMFGPFARRLGLRFYGASGLKVFRIPEQPSMAKDARVLTNNQKSFFSFSRSSAGGPHQRNTCYYSLLTVFRPIKYRTLSKNSYDYTY